MKEIVKKISRIWIFVVFLVIAIAMAGNVSAKSLYVIANINQAPTPVQAYDIQPAPTYLVYQATYGVPYYGIGGVGLTIDTDSKMLFVTYESSNKIQLVDATTMTNKGTTTAPGASNLAGIVVDQDKQKVYTVDRNTNKLYIYSWNPSNTTLTLDGIQLLSGVSGAHGIALDEVHDLLYVGDLTATVKIFNTADWSSAGSFTVSQAAMGISVDVSNGFAYTGNAYPPYGSLGLLSKYDLNTNTETTVNIRLLTGSASDNVVGLAVDPSTGLLYITTGNQGLGGSDRLMVFDSNLNLLYQTGDIGDPTGLCVPGKEISYNPLNLGKDDGVAQCEFAGNTITYTISYNNGNQYNVNNVVITDTLPTEVTFISATDGGVYDAIAHKVNWNIGTVTSGSGGSVSVTVQIKAGTPEGSTITDYATIDSDETPPTTQSENTVICTIPVATEFGSLSVIVAILLTTPAFAYLMVKRNKREKFAF